MSKKMGRPKAHNLTWSQIFFKALYDKSSNGCFYHKDCWTCPLPACICDGYDPQRKPSKKLSFSTYRKVWDDAEIMQFHELELLDLPDEVMANIFRTTIVEIQKKRKVMNVVKGSR